MKRRTLDIIFATGGIFVAALLVVLGLVLADQQAFAKDYVKGELGAQKIYFSDNPTDDEKNWKPESVCLVEHKGKLLETGEQAECYAKYYIAKHMDTSAKNAKLSAPITVKQGGQDVTLSTMEGQTYGTLGAIRTALLNDGKAAKEAGDTAKSDARTKDAEAVAGLRTSMQTGETLRGLLLTTYGFSIFGDKAGLAASVLYGLGGLLVLLSVAGFVHAFITPKDKVVLAGSAAKAPSTPVTNN